MRAKQQTVVFLIVLACAIGNFAASQNTLNQNQPNATENFQDEIVLPKAPYLKMLGLNYNTFTVSMVWLKSLLYYGAFKFNKTEKTPPPKHLKDYALLMTNIDTRFQSPYEWFASTFLLSRKQVSGEDLEQINKILDIGIERFPTEYQYPYMAGMNFLGYGLDRKPEARIKELKKGIQYLESAAQLPGASSVLPFTIAQMYRRKAILQNQLNGKTLSHKEIQQQREEQVGFFQNMYNTTTDNALRARIRKKLLGLGVSESQLEQVDQQQIIKLQNQYEYSRTYLPINLWIWIHYPIEQ